MNVEQRCPGWPFCTGHPGPTRAERAREQYEARKRVERKRELARLLIHPAHVTGPTTGLDWSIPCRCEDPKSCPCRCHAMTAEEKQQ